MTDFADAIEAAVARATEIQAAMIVNEDRITVSTLTCDGHTHWCAVGYGFMAEVVTPAGVELKARTVREAYRTGIELVGPDDIVVANDLSCW